MSSTIYTVTASKPIQYELISSVNLFSHRNLTLLNGREDKKGGKIAVFCDPFIYNNLEDEIRQYFNHHGIELYLFAVSSMESNKNVNTFLDVLDDIDMVGLKRRSEPVLAIGGGVVMDIVGFACSTYRRSIPCIKIPTTLMGYVDASIGIKHGVDFNGSKNRVGSFDPPHSVILDRGFLETLPRRHIINGLAEVFKIAIIKDISLYELIQTEGKEAILDQFQTVGNGILTKSIVGLITELESNLYETELRRPSDYGHTFSPIIEMRNIDKILHGEAVSIDIAISVAISARRKLITMPKFLEIIALMKSLGLPTFHKSIDADMLMEGLAERTLHRNGKQNAPMASINTKHTSVFLDDIGIDDINHAIEYLK